MPAHIDSVVFVYQQTKKPYRTKCVYHDDPQPGKGWKHTGSIDPAKWLEFFMNNPDERNRQIESISA